MSAPNDFGSNLIKAEIVMPIDAIGVPISATNPVPIQLVVNGALVSASNPLPISST